MEYQLRVSEMINVDLQFERYRQQMKLQQKLASQACLAHTRLDIEMLSIELARQLDELNEAFKKGVAVDYVERIQYGFKGTVAKAAQEKLQTMTTPLLKAPLVV
ncbi:MULTISPECIES: hypothetical protein [unclassified Granulicatella]|uniref:hypothetical protein n=1 Tax=unclassified Granulicatella TaxID=2630493 RepID=UPI001073F07A|nr:MULTISPECIES: hypothetical protein [unclassified Granulicatella]MBF0780236.1 hypothetical protein [Granulicatella sp. 19428wC4_WM01]TFU95670.1 hypothetical protein E4T68_03910 [Granulicatella sp. WM01]